MQIKFGRENVLICLSGLHAFHFTFTVKYAYDELPGRGKFASM